MLKAGLMIYLAIGLAQLALPRVRASLRDSTADVTLARNPRWKVVSFHGIIYVSAAVLWPIFMASWIGRPRSVWDELQDNPAFRGQQELMKAFLEMSNDGVDADEIPGATGEFGLSSGNPVPCQTVFGSTAYLARLRTAEGGKVSYERICSVGSTATPHPVDAYAIRSADGEELGTIYISLYQRRNSAKVPKGFMLAGLPPRETSPDAAYGDDPLARGDHR
jgi:hypothetical protein